jgi:hypothetical protein
MSCTPYVSGRRVLCLVAAVALLGAPCQAQPPSPKAEQHELLKAWEGVWDVVMQMEGAPAAKGQSKNELACDGLWLAVDYRMDDGSFSGRGLDGYDPEKKKYISIWTDTMTAAPLIFEGDYDERTRSLTMTTRAPGPDGQPANWKSVTKFIDADHHKFEMFLVGEGGQESRTLEVDYTRRKP